jgi:cellulose synthase/poly-beta-1,6-N-acetylglucosamine synthase-like glycosyltransferase/peptidoglycan/xylan/chitin deacetylase (PgdA/CDA1 family)/spore germination protein YaaH
METNHVFHDPAGRRWRHVRRIMFFCTAVFTVVLGVFIVSVLVNPLLPKLDLQPIHGLPRAADAQPQPPPLVVTRQGQMVMHVEAALKREEEKTAVVPGKRLAEMKIKPLPKVLYSSKVKGKSVLGRPLAIGFYVNWDDSSYQSLKHNINQLDWVVPEWLRLQGGSNLLACDIDPRVVDLIRRENPHTIVVPIINNAKDGKWYPDVLARAIDNKAKRKQLIDTIVQVVTKSRFNGLCVDFEEVPQSAQADLIHFMQELYVVFKPHGWVLTQAVPFDDSSWNYPSYQASTDYLMLMAYDQHWNTSNAGSISGQDWFESILDKRLQDLDPAKTIVCIGGYGYDWGQKGEATELTFQEAVLEARDSEAKITLDPDSLNPSFNYEEEDGSKHTVWFLDAVTAYNQILTTRTNGCAGIALWRLGSEDPSMWSVFGSSRTTPSPDKLRVMQGGYDVDFEGTGEILQIEAQPQNGSRDIKVNQETGLIIKDNYTSIPSSYVIRRRGGRQGLIALTFDDGPDPKWTPKILDILKQEHVPATFFIIGQNGESNPGLIRRMFTDGHEIGNHTFTHPNLGEIPGYITDLELRATERLIESLTNHSTKLFRAPYFGDAEPTTPDEIMPAARAQRLGYLTIGLHVDPDDWAKPGSDIIVQRTIEGATTTDPDKHGQVILLHDGGGNRSQTVEALPVIIHQLRARGFRFVTISDLAGLTHDQVMPPLTQSDSLYEHIDAMTFSTIAVLGWALSWIFIIGIILGLGRMVFIGTLAFAQWLRNRRREATHSGESYEPFVSVLVPAYNEERVIVRTIQNLLSSDYPHFEIIVVDDGSSDRTSDVVSKQFQAEPRIRLFTKETGGKSAALNYGLHIAQGAIIVALDADTLFNKGTIRALARRFVDPQIGAIAGNAKVGNRINIITRWQALEYVTSQNLDRRAFASLNCITVVPGAVGAWRRDLLEHIGGFSSDTLAEDQDLTLSIRKLGYKIGYEENAIAWTEAPDTVRTLAKQRFRWSYGTLQCMWKHSHALFRPKYGSLGLIALPNVWIFQILFPLLSPIMDLLLVWVLISAGLERLEHPAQYVITNFQQVLFYYALFLSVDWLAAVFAFALEKKEQWGLLWWLFLQRFCYRQVMYYVMIKSVITAMHGGLVAWGKLERKATVEART